MCLYTNSFQSSDVTIDEWNYQNGGSQVNCIQISIVLLVISVEVCNNGSNLVVKLLLNIKKCYPINCTPSQKNLFSQEVLQRY